MAVPRSALLVAAVLGLLLADSVLPALAGLRARSRLHGRHRRRDALRGTPHALPEVSDDDLPPAQWFNQSLDHFNAEVNATYLQRYYVNDTFWSGNGPVFLYIEGEGAASPYDVLEGEHMELAQAFGALVFAVEHRYYGASVPTADLSTSNLKWLSSQQALADLATFHAFAVQQYNLTASNTWICFGGSYPGALSAWFRIKYPHLVFGAISSSSPVHAVANFEGYNEVVAVSLATNLVGGSAQCASSVGDAFEAVNAALTSANGRTQLSSTFSTCTSLSNASEDDIGEFVGNLAGLFQGTVQYNNEEPGLNIQEICEVFTNSSGAPLKALAELATMAYGDSCMDISYTDALNELLNVTVDPNAGGVGDRQWLWQTCTQFGYYQTCDSNTSCLFDTNLMSLADNFELCTQLFGISGENTEERIAFSNDDYGGADPAGSRIVFVNGAIDPWHALSIIQTIPYSQQTAIFIPGTAHCANMEPASPSDPLPLVTARKQVAQQIYGWLQEASGNGAGFGPWH